VHNIWQEKDLINATCKDTRHGLPAALSSAKKHDKIHLLHATRKEPCVFILNSYFQEVLLPSSLSYFLVSCRKSKQKKRLAMLITGF